MAEPRIVPVERPVMRLQLFGAMSALTYDGSAILPRGLKARAMLAYLALAGEDAIPRKRFEGLLWSQRWEEQARASVRQSVRELAVALGRVEPQILEVTRDTIRLDRARVWIEGLSQRASGTPPSAAGTDPATFLETLIGLDPRFDDWIGEMRAGLEPRDGTSRAAPAAEVHQGAIKRAPYVDVVPFAAFGANEENAHMAAALAHELATGLARFRWIAVRLLNGDAQEASTQADYRLEGHFAHGRSGGRLTIRLVDRGSADAIVWTHAETIESTLRPDFVADIAERVVGRLDPEILAIETRKVTHAPVVADDAYALLLRAIPKLHARTFGEAEWMAGRNLLERAIALAPDFGRAQAFLAQAVSQGIAQGWTPADPMTIATVDRLAAAAITNDPHDSIGLSLAGHIRSYVHRDFDGAKDLFRRAIEANPSCAVAWAYSAVTYAYCGEAKEARRRFNRAGVTLRQGPYDALLGFETLVAYAERDWPTVIRVARQALVRMPGLTTFRKHIIMAQCMLGDYDAARAEQVALMSEEPGFTWEKHLASYPFGRESDRAAMRQVVRGLA